VIRFNEQGADSLINIPSPGMPPKLNARHKAFLARIVEDRTDYTAGEVRRFAQRAKDAAQARRLLAIAAVEFGGRP
jgi:transposase